MELVEAALGDWSNEVPVESKYKSKNLEAERRRRTKLNGKLLALRSLVPRITKARHFPPFFFRLTFIFGIT